jgi:hypothetical protein
MPVNRMNRDEFYAAVMPLDDERLRKALWTVPLPSGAAPLVWRLSGSSRLFPVVSGPRAESVLIARGERRMTP